MSNPLRNPQIVWRVEKHRRQQVLEALAAGEDVDDRGTVILIQSGMMHQLNLVGGMVWERCDGSRSTAQIAAELATEFAVAPEEVEADVAEFVADLVKRGWLSHG